VLFARLGSRGLGHGRTTLLLVTRSLAPGSYRLVAAAFTGETQTVAFTVRRPRRR
jgi:hypothetical protein